MDNSFKLTSISKKSLIILSFRLSKNEVDPWRMLYNVRSIITLAVASKSFTCNSKVAGFV